MKKIWVLLLMCGCALNSQVHASFISDAIYYPKLMNQKKKIVPKIMNDLLTEKVLQRYKVDTDGVLSIASGFIEYGIYQIHDKCVEERIYIRIFHAREGERPYTSIEDFRTRENEKYGNDRINGLYEDVTFIHSDPNDSLYFISRWNPGGKDSPRSQGLTRAVLVNGRIYLVIRGLHGGKYTPEEKEKWISRLENLTYLNDLSKFGDRSSEGISEPPKRESNRRAVRVM